MRANAEEKRIKRVEDAERQFAEFIEGKSAYGDAERKQLLKLGVQWHKLIVKLAKKCDDDSLVIGKLWREVELNLAVMNSVPETEVWIEPSINYAYSMANMINKEVTEATMPDVMKKYLKIELEEIREELED